ncbi:Protein of unknown function [Pseudoxanthomonas sp. CF125]|nr:Protein of unknown function [Pseudoxanthomonas sp. CF125]
MVIVGSNGSGKSRLGSWLENPTVQAAAAPPAFGNMDRLAYRVGAQRLLALPEQAQRVAPERAQEILLQGNEMTNGPSRVQGDAVVGQLNDFGPLLNALYAQRVRVRDQYFVLAQQAGGPPGPAPSDALDRLRSIWMQVFPERELIIQDHAVSARSPGNDSTYSASKMSDGERVGFYLIGHVLLAPENLRIVIDEPELHLHPSIQANLWNALEAERPDCAFIYITHDLGFAASRAEAAIVVLQDYLPPNPNNRVAMGPPPDAAGTWKWRSVTRVEEIPVDVVLRILGARRPTVFVEGTAGSLDIAVYQVLLPDFYVVPGGNCEQVQKSVKAFRAQKALHHVDVQGIVDRDDRDAAQIERLREQHVFTLPVAAVENLLAGEECLRAFMVRSDIAVTDHVEKLGEIALRVNREMAKLRDWAISERAQYAIRRKLQSLRRSDDTLASLEHATGNAIASAVPADIYRESAEVINQALADPTSLDAVLVNFRNKGILSEVAKVFGTSRKMYVQSVIDLLRTNGDLWTLLRAKVPLPPA